MLPLSEFSEKELAKCKRYGLFMYRLSRPLLEGHFWGLMIIALMFLVSAAAAHAESERIAKNYE
jgi:hypothetical protein